jgi:hypothetical protein
MKLFTAIHDDPRLLGPFLRHYTQYEITEFFIGVPHSLAFMVRGFMSEYQITLHEGLDVAESVVGGTAAVSEMRRIHQRDDEWVVIVDLDEFAEFVPNIHHLVSHAELEGANIVRGIMYDRFSIDGKLREVNKDSDLKKLFPVKARFVASVMRGCDHKGVLVKGRLKPAGAHHIFEGERLFSKTIEIAHYKSLTGAIDRLKSAIGLVKGAGLPWYDEYERALDHYQRHGRFAWEEFGGVLAEAAAPSGLTRD